MKRPFVLVGFCYLLTLAAAVSLGASISLVIACIMLLGFIVTLLCKQLRSTMIFPIAFLTAAIALSSFSAYTLANIEPLGKLDGKDAIISGTVCEMPYQSNGHHYYVVELNSMNIKNAPKVKKIRLSCQNALNVDVYGTIKGKVHFYQPKGGKGYDSRSYYASKGITMFAFLYEYEPVLLSPPTNKPLYYYALKIRESMLNSIGCLLPPQQASLINGVLLGDTSHLSPEVKSDFNLIGISHILSVSGLHMATMAQFFLLLLLSLKVPKRPAAAGAALGVFCFMAITGFVPSVMRSGIMYLIYLVGILLDRQADSLNSLGIAVFFLCLVNPYAAADVGLLLSFSATFGLIVLSQRMNDWFKMKCKNVHYGKAALNNIFSVLSTTAGAVIFTLPITIYTFGTVSLIAPLSNLLELVPSTFLMEFSAIAALLNLIPPLTLFAKPFALLAGLLAKYMETCAHWLAQFPYASISASFDFVKVWLAAVFLLFGITLLMMNNRRLLRATTILSTIMLLCGILSYQISLQGVTRVAVLDSGKGASIVLTKNRRAAILGCGGYHSAVSNYLLRQGIQKIDYMQLISENKDEYSNARQLLFQYLPKHILLKKENYSDSILKNTLKNENSANYYDNKATIRLWKNVNIETDQIMKSKFTRVQIGDVSIVICPPKSNVEGMNSDWCNSDFVIVQDTPENMELLRPICTVLSMQEEAGLQTLSKANKISTATYMTCGKGSIVIDVKSDRTVTLRRES